MKKEIRGFFEYGDEKALTNFFNDLFESFVEKYEEKKTKIDRFNRYLFNSDSSKDFAKKYKRYLLDWTLKENYDVYNTLSFNDYFWYKYKLELLPFDHFLTESSQLILKNICNVYNVNGFAIKYNKTFKRYYLFVYSTKTKEQFLEKISNIDFIFSNHSKKLVEGVKDIISEWVSKDKFKEYKDNKKYPIEKWFDDVKYIHSKLVNLIDKDKYFLSKFNYDFKKYYLDNDDYKMKIEDFSVDEMDSLTANKVISELENYYLKKPDFANKIISSFENAKSLKDFDLIINNFLTDEDEEGKRTSLMAFIIVIDSLWKDNKLELIPIDYFLKLLLDKNIHVLKGQRIDLRIEYNKFFNRYYLMSFNFKTKNNIKDNSIVIDFFLSHHNLELVKIAKKTIEEWLEKQLYEEFKYPNSPLIEQEIIKVFEKTKKLINPKEYLISNIGYNFNKSCVDNFSKDKKS